MSYEYSSETNNFNFTKLKFHMETDELKELGTIPEIDFNLNSKYDSSDFGLEVVRSLRERCEEFIKMLNEDYERIGVHSNTITISIGVIKEKIIFYFTSNAKLAYKLENDDLIYRKAISRESNIYSITQYVENTGWGSYHTDPIYDLHIIIDFNKKQFDILLEDIGYIEYD